MVAVLTPCSENRCGWRGLRVNREGFDLFADSTPLGYVGGDANLYRYVGNNPLMHREPLGLCEEDGSSDGINAVLCATTTRTSKSTAKPATLDGQERPSLEG